jgi:hypothetical protein
VSYGELDSLFEQFFALVEATVRLPPGADRRSAFGHIGDYGSRIDQIAVQLLEQRREVNSGRLTRSLGDFLEASAISFWVVHLAQSPFHVSFGLEHSRTSFAPETNSPKRNRRDQQQTKPQQNQQT